MIYCIWSRAEVFCESYYVFSENLLPIVTVVASLPLTRLRFTGKYIETRDINLHSIVLHCTALHCLVSGNE